MIKFIRYFIMEWNNYPSLVEFCSHLPKEQIEEMEKMDLERGIKPFKNRLDFAFRNAVIYCKNKG